MQENKYPHQKKFNRYPKLKSPRPEQEITLADLHAEIKNNKVNKATQDLYQLLLRSGDKVKARAIKETLPSVTPSCICHLWRCEYNIFIYTSYLVFDRDF